MPRQLRPLARRGLARMESGFDAAFSPAWNPLYHLGALGWFCYWIVVASGIYLYIFFDTGTREAYDSVQSITHGQWYAGGVLRSLHRYASDLLLVVVLVHLFREFIMDRMRGPRWFAWVSGVPLIWMIYAAGITGYWMVWDQLAQYVAITTTEWLDTLPLFGEPVARNFVHDSTLSGRFFTLLAFIHIAVPLLMLFGMWLHVARQVRPDVNPPRGLAAGLMVAMLVLSLVRPVYSQAPADLSTLPAVVELDWFYLLPLPLSEHVPGAWLWAAFAVATLALAALPWLPPAARVRAAEVHLDQCNGCGRCNDDCPFSAVSMVMRTDGAAYARQAEVNADLCVGCGVCTGACPTATPFRRRTALVAGIEQPGLTTAALRDAFVAAAVERDGDDPCVVVVSCSSNHDVAALEGLSPVISVPCLGMLPPTFIDFALSRRYADALVLAGCRDGACFYRLGLLWTSLRIDGERDPKLRARVPRNRVRRCFVGADQGDRLRQEVIAVRDELRAAGNKQAGENRVA